MNSIIGVINNTVSINKFNRGLAGKIFDEVKKTGAKVVMKNNTDECVLLSPKEYTDLIDELNDAHLLVIASQRLQNLDSSDLISQDEVYKRLGIKEEDLDDYDQVEFE